MLDVRNLGMDLGRKVLFHDVNLTLLPNQRYGIVGANGAGKSTFLGLLIAQDTPTEGTVDKPKDATLGILQQDHFRYEHDPIVDVVIKGDATLWAAMQEKDALLMTDHLTEAEGYRLCALEEIILHRDGYEADTKARTILSGLGIHANYHDGPLSALSGGYKLRVLLAQLLFQNPDIMLLDEPTNHLDIVSIAWLEEFLKTRFKGLLIFVSHDRELLNNLATRILDIDYETITEYVGNYNAFIKNKAEILIQKQQELDNKQRKIAAMQTNVDRFRAGTRARQAQSKMKMIEKIKLPEIKSSSVIKPYFNFEMERQSGKSVLKVEQIRKQFNEKQVLNNISFKLQRGEKCAVIGPNGIGKSTLLKILLNQLSANHGTYEWSETVKIGYFAQDYRTQLSQDMTVWQWLENKVTTATTQEMRNVLGQVLFRGHDVEKKLSVLSGGESARLVLASLILEKNNVLVLDEPTNHLDLESIDALIEALHRFKGAILFVSHNRYFIDHIATRIMALTEQGGVRNYLGNYHDYLSQYGQDHLARD
jgi:ATPase subunit of ABC transporter with duplicated ATPase domains